MTDVARPFLDKSRDLLTADYLPKIKRSLEAISDADAWWRPNDASNSIAYLMLQLSGNVRQWIVDCVGQRADARNRQQEFDDRSRLSRSQLLAKLRTTVAEADEVLRNVDPVALLDRRRIQHYDVTVLEAIYHVV